MRSTVRTHPANWWERLHHPSPERATVTDLPTWTTALHVAYYCPMSGDGRLVLPLPEDDSADTWGATALAAADGIDMLRMLALHGVQPAEDDEHGGPWCHVGYRADGREVVALYGVDPITSTPSVAQLAEAGAALRLAAGL